MNRSMLATVAVFVLGISEACVATPPVNTDDLLGEIRTLHATDPMLRSHRARVVRNQLINRGEAAIETTRKAAQSETDSALQNAYEIIAALQLAKQVSPILARGFDSGLSFDGQYVELRSAGPEIEQTLLLLVGDEATHFGVRIASCDALADIGSAKTLPKLRELYHDLLLPDRLRERIGTLMAIFGDAYAVQQELTSLAGMAQNRQSQSFVGANIRLADLNYRIRDYAAAIECYERIIPLLEQILTQQRDEEVKQALGVQIALHYYNTACSCSLNRDFEKARKHLTRCIELDPSHFAHITQDGDFARLRASDGFESFQKELTKKLPKESL